MPLPYIGRSLITGSIIASIISSVSDSWPKTTLSVHEYIMLNPLIVIVSPVANIAVIVHSIIPKSGLITGLWIRWTSPGSRWCIVLCRKRTGSCRTKRRPIRLLISLRIAICCSIGYCNWSVIYRASGNGLWFGRLLIGSLRHCRRNWLLHRLWFIIYRSSWLVGRPVFMLPIFWRFLRDGWLFFLRIFLCQYQSVQSQKDYGQQGFFQVIGYDWILHKDAF